MKILRNFKIKVKRGIFCTYFSFLLDKSPTLITSYNLVHQQLHSCDCEKNKFFFFRRENIIIFFNLYCLYIFSIFIDHLLMQIVGNKIERNSLNLEERERKKTKFIKQTSPISTGKALKALKLKRSGKSLIELSNSSRLSSKATS